MDIMQAEKNKKYIRLAVYLLRKKVGKQGTTKAIHSDLINNGNPAVQFTTQLLNYAADNIDEKYQSGTVKELGELLLWILIKDTAYRDVVFWILWQFLMNADDLKSQLKSYVKEPEKWYVNIWHKTKEHTAELKKKNIIPQNAISFEEEIFVPSLQQKKLQKL